YRTVRVMAGFATVEPDGRGLEHKRSTLIDMAFQARLFVSLRLVHHPGGGGGTPRGGRRSVRGVGIRALHETLIDAMFEGHGKLGAHRGVAGVTKIHLLFL